MYFPNVEARGIHEILISVDVPIYYHRKNGDEYSLMYYNNKSNLYTKTTMYFPNSNDHAIHKSLTSFDVQRLSKDIQECPKVIQRISKVIQRFNF